METYKIDRLKITMWLIEWKNAWQDWMEDTKLTSQVTMWLIVWETIHMMMRLIEWKNI